MGTTADYISPGRCPRFLGCLLRGPHGAANHTWSASWLSRCHQVPSAIGSHPRTAGADVSLPLAREHSLARLFVQRVSLRPWPVHLDPNAEAGSGEATCWALHCSDVGRPTPMTYSNGVLPSPHLPSYLNRVTPGPSSHTSREFWTLLGFRQWRVPRMSAHHSHVSLCSICGCRLGHR